MLAAGVLVAGKYRVSKKLGEGAMGSVWLATNEVTDREFAIKVLLPQAAEAPTALARFLREARVCGALRHPSILEIYDAGEAPELGGAPFLVMERLDGAPLDLVLQRRGALPPRLAVDILVHIARGLHLAHGKGVVHRDIKPANVFLHRPGSGAIVPKVLDFGISKVIGARSPDVALTNTAAILGSPIYMSPEQMDAGGPLDARSDVHALGVLLWELLTGKPPFASTSYNLLVVEIMRGPRPRLRDEMPGASAALAAAVERSFAIEARDRFASAAGLADALDVELAKLGGGVLAGRGAAVEFLSALDLGSDHPPPVNGTTTVPLSVDPASPRSPAAVTGKELPRASATSFADTEIAASGGAPTPATQPAAAASTGGSRGATSRSRFPRVGVGVALALALVGILALTMSSRKESNPSREAARAEPPASAPAAAVPLTATPSPAAAAPPAPMASIPGAAPSGAGPLVGAGVGAGVGVGVGAATASAAIAAVRANPPPNAPRKPVRTPPTGSVPTGRPRIDQSGL
jgi:serine/threonine protein kinase